MLKGAVWVTQGKHTRRLRRSSKEISPGQTIHLYYNESVLDASVPDAQLIKDYDKYSVWYKPRGMLCQGSKWGDHTTITRYVEQNLQPQRNAFLVHRLDRATSGLILIGHTKQATTQLCELFQDRQLDKRYLAIVQGKTPDKLTIETEVDSKPAKSHLTLEAYDDKQDRSLVEVKIDTGRKHQIRCHMASIGHTVVGDRLYNSDDQSVDLQLTAYKLSFTCPIEQQPIELILPESLQPYL